MPINFRLEKEHGLLDWSLRGDGAADLTHEEAAIVAQAEAASAQKDIAKALQQIAEALKGKMA